MKRFLIITILFLTLTSPAFAKGEPYVIDTVPMNTAKYVGMPEHSDSYFGPGGISNTIEQVFNFFIAYGKGADGKEKMAQPRWNKEGKMTSYTVASTDRKGGPLVPDSTKFESMKVGLPTDNAFSRNNRPQAAPRPCTPNSEKEKHGKTIEMIVGENYDDNTLDFFGSSAILCGMLGCKIKDGKVQSMSSLQVETPPSELFLAAGDKFTLKPGQEDNLFDCNTDSDGKKVPATNYNIINHPGDLQSGKDVPFYHTISSSVLSTLQGLIGLGKCVGDQGAARCIALAKQSIELGTEITQIQPIYTYATAAVAGGIQEEDIGKGLSKDRAKDLAANKGWANAFLQEQTKVNVPMENSHGYVPQKLTVHASPGNEGEEQMPIGGAYVMKQTMNNLSCSLLPSSVEMYKNLSCESITASRPDTSTWAINGGTNYSHDSAVTGDLSRSAIAAAANEVGIPVCVLEGIAVHEGGAAIKECKPNACSAMGPMQFTTGKGPANDPDCKTCAAGFCPNTWSTWGNGGDPCNAKDALSAAARKLKANGGLVPENQTPIKSQQAGIIKAGYNYFGSKNSELARKRFGGCEYGEALYKKCDPSYICPRESEYKK